MKKLIIVSVIFCLSSFADASLYLTFNGIIDPPDSSIVMMPSETAIIGIYADNELADLGVVLGVPVGNPGAITCMPDGVNYFITYDGLFDLDVQDAADYFGFSTAVFADLARPEGIYIPDGIVVDGLLFHCDSIGDITLLLLDVNTGELLDSQVIHSVGIPEPATFGLLAIGSLLLRRRSAYS